MCKERMPISSFQHAPLNQSTLNVVVFKHDFFTQNFDRVELRFTLQLRQQNLHTSSSGSLRREFLRLRSSIFLGEIEDMTT